MIRPATALAMALTLVLMLAELVAPLPGLEVLWASDRSLALQVVTELRLPRMLLAAGYGATLGLTGSALQALFANPLASPDITGSSSGAAVGVVIAAYWFSVGDPLALAVCGALGSGAALAALVVLAGLRSETSTLLLAGLAISLMAAAATSLALALAPSPFAFYDSFDWLMGSLVDRSLVQAAAALVPAGIACLLLARRAGALDQMALGEDVVASLGYRIDRLRTEVVALGAIAVGACVSVCGAVGFVGLIAPILARRWSAGHPGRAMGLAATLGAALLLAADLAVRSAPLGRPLPVGIVTALIGTPLFLWTVARMRWRLPS